MSGESQPGAGGKGSAGYWGVSTDEAREAAFEARYRELIPKGKYKSRAHSPLHCTVCTNVSPTFSFCPKVGFVFGAYPRVYKQENDYFVESCGLCGETRHLTDGKPAKLRRVKGLSIRKNPKVEKP